jgi:hypothetical protein
MSILESPVNTRIVLPHLLVILGLYSTEFRCHFNLVVPLHCYKLEQDVTFLFDVCVFFTTSLQAEASRLSRQLNGDFSSRGVADILKEMFKLSPDSITHCFHNRPIVIRLCNVEHSTTADDL